MVHAGLQRSFSSPVSGPCNVISTSIECARGDRRCEVSQPGALVRRKRIGQSGCRWADNVLTTPCQLHLNFFFLKDSLHLNFDLPFTSHSVPDRPHFRRNASHPSAAGPSGHPEPHMRSRAPTPNQGYRPNEPAAPIRSRTLSAAFSNFPLVTT